MRIFALIPALVALVTSVSSTSVDTSCGLEVGCGGGSNKRDFLEHPMRRTTHGLTNAELLRRGLPLKNPVMRRGTPVRRSSPSSVPPATITYTGVIEVLDSNNNILGYVSSNLLQGAQAGYDPSLANALVVSFTTDQTGSGTQLDLTATNMNPSYPLFGLIQGRDDQTTDLQPGSYQYLYPGGIDAPGTQPDAVPTDIDNSYSDAHGDNRYAESAVWTYDANTGVLTPQWINSDGSSPSEGFWTQDTALYVGGDQSAFNARYPAPVVTVTFVFIPQ